jgi:hypothetical protein
VKRRNDKNRRESIDTVLRTQWFFVRKTKKEKDDGI